MANENFFENGLGKCDAEAMAKVFEAYAENAPWNTPWEKIKEIGFNYNHGNAYIILTNGICILVDISGKVKFSVSVKDEEKIFENYEDALEAILIDH